MAWPLLPSDRTIGNRAETADLVELDAAANRLRFDFWYDGQYGPIHYDLERVTPR